MELKHRIREAMESAGLKPLQFSKAVGVSSGAVTHWLNGATQSLKAETANRMQQVTGYNANWIITGLGEKLSSTKPTPVAHEGHTYLALELATVFDVIPESDTLMRSRAFSIASTAIAAILQGDAVSLVLSKDQKPQ